MLLQSPSHLRQLGSQFAGERMTFERRKPRRYSTFPESLSGLAMDVQWLLWEK